MLSQTNQVKLSRQTPCESPCLSGIFRFTLDYPIQSTSLFDQASSSKLDYPLESISDPKGLLDHLISPRPSRFSTLHGVS